ncbi:kinase-like protein [Marasmius fiardii PR-910]|nr:kinase-like protein [Marasmius fiardii PR-910]
MKMQTKPSIGHLEEELERIIKDKAERRAFVEQKGQDAQAWLDRMQLLADYPSTSSQLRTSVLTIMLRLSKNSGLYPICLAMKNVRKSGDYPIAYGGYGEVWKGIIGESNEFVCLKIIKIYAQSDLDKLCKAYLQEAIVWRQMKHPNVLPFLGIYHLENQQICLISPWMEKGNLVQYVRSTPRESIEHYTLVYDVANGLSYLHSKDIVHADLKGVNILITPSGRACIGDFGLSRVLESQGLTNSGSRPIGTSRWLAPELLYGGRSTKESDIYAFSCVCYEIFTGLHPFPEIKLEATVVYHVVQGKHSSRPQNAPELHEYMWTIMETCWNSDSSCRASADDILYEVWLNTPGLTVAESDWNDSLSHEIWNNADCKSRSIV